jgi:outer membrane protein TolC
LLRPIYYYLLLLSVFANAQDQLDVFETQINQDISEESQDPRRNIKNWDTPKRKIDPNEKVNENNGRLLELRSVIEEGLRRNPYEKIRFLQKEQIDLNKTDLFQSFWLPEISLDLQTGNHLIDRVHSSSQSNQFMGAQDAPAGSLGLLIEDYTIFNWGRDYLSYLNSKQTLQRAGQQLAEGRRRLKFGLIGQYFNLIKSKQVLRIYQEQVRQTSFIHRIAKEKLQLRKISVQEYYQTRSDYLRSQTEYQQALFEVGIEEEKMANLLGDDYQGSYRSVEQLKFLRINTSLEEALQFSQESSVDFRDAKLAYDNASRSYEQTLKENLPLPKFTLNLGSYSSSFGPQGKSWNYSTGSGNRNVEIAAAINMKWTLLGEGGLFNHRINKQAYLNQRISEINFFNTKRTLDVRVRTIFKTIRFLEQKVDIAQYQHKNAQSNYDSVLDNFISGKTTYPDIKLAIDNLVISHVNTENVKYDHLVKKLELADLMGLEDFPGENFEALAVK